MFERITTQQSVQMRDLLLVMPLTYDELVTVTGMVKPRVARWVKNNRKDIRVTSWAPDKNGRPFVPVFSWGAGADVPRPGRALTPAEQMRKVRERRAAERGLAQDPSAKP